MILPMREAALSRLALICCLLLPSGASITARVLLPSVGSNLEMADDDDVAGLFSNISPGAFAIFVYLIRWVE
jgi:hypothetical protein